MPPLLSRLEFRSAGESHGQGVTVLLEGLPRGLPVDLAAVDALLRLRQGGAGRGGRQRIEHDRVEVHAGLRGGVTLGSPLALWIGNRDQRLETAPQLASPRPGHVDLAGCFRYGDHDIRASLERASARETVARVAAGAVLQQLLAHLGCHLLGFTRSVGGARLDGALPGSGLEPPAVAALRAKRDASRLYTLDPDADAAMLAVVQAAAAAGDSAGGEVEVHAVGVLPGVGSHLQWHERLDARLAAAVMSVQAIKGVEIGLGFAAAARPGSAVHDEIVAAPGGLQRTGNNAGGIEGGTSNGQPVVVRAAMKPISTLRRPLRSVALASGEPAPASHERADVCAVGACALVVEAMVALVVADATLARVGGETLAEVVDRHRDLADRARRIGGG